MGNVRKKILAAVLAATKPELMGIRGKKSGDKSSIDSSEKIEKLMTEQILIEEKSADEIVAEEIATENIVTEEVETSEIVADESITVEPIVEEITLKKAIIEEKSMYAYEFEGKYWLRYSDYGHKGLYFDGSKAISKAENQGVFEKDYFVGVEERNKNAFLLSYNSIGKTVFSSRKEALKKIREAEHIEYLRSFEPEIMVVAAFGQILPKEIFFITSQELEDMYPDMTAKEREYAILDEIKSVYSGAACNGQDLDVFI